MLWDLMLMYFFQLAWSWSRNMEAKIQQIEYWSSTTRNRLATTVRYWFDIALFSLRGVAKILNWHFFQVNTKLRKWLRTCKKKNLHCRRWQWSWFHWNRRLIRSSPFYVNISSKNCTKFFPAMTHRYVCCRNGDKNILILSYSYQWREILRPRSYHLIF